MGLTVPASFTAAERAEVNQLSQKVYLLLGNYASSPGYGASATSSGADASGDYPASGPINGDRTEINIGSAAAADNGVGKASWKSSGTPDAGDLVWHKIDLGQARTFNRLKLYHRNGHGLKSFFIEASADDVTYYVIAATSDAVGGGLGWGEGAWGDGNWGGGGGEPTPASFATTMQLDTIDLPADVTYRYIRTVAQSTQVAADKAEIVALEVYRKIDVSDRVIGIDIDRQQDYKLKNNLASACNLELSNVDRFFSARYVPTDAETAAGFVNSELRPGLGIIVELGYYGVNVSLFVGSIDSIASSSRARTAMITARDGIKGLVNNVVSTKLKTNSDIGTVIQYLLNQANISNYEMSVDSTTIVLDYFFTYATSILTTIQQLQQACGDANFRFDESGVATFRMYMNAVSQSHTDTSKADFEAGVLRNIDTATTPGQYSARYTASGSWTIATTPAIVASVAGVGELSAFLTDEDSAANNAYGTWEGGIDRGTGVGTWWIVVAASIPIRVGYRLEVSATDLKLIKRTRGGTVDFPVAVDTTLLDIARAPASGDTYKVTRDGANLFTLYVNGVSMGTVTDAIWTVSTASVAGGSAGTAVFTGLKITTAGAAEQPRYLFAAQAVSQTIDMTAAVTSLGSLSADYSLPGASSISWYTATSDDGATWDAWVAAAVGTPIASAVKRYLKYKAVLNIPASASGGTTPIVFDVTVTWGTGSGSSKYPSDHQLRLPLRRLPARPRHRDHRRPRRRHGDPQLDPGAVDAADSVWRRHRHAVAGDDQRAGGQGLGGQPDRRRRGDVHLLSSRATGMDTSRMTGANPAAAVVTFGGGAVGSWTMTQHPTQPVLTVVITTGGTITDLRLIGKAFSSSDLPIVAQASDAASIDLYAKRNYPLTNNYIINSGVAQSVANRLLLNSKAPTAYIKSARVQPTWSIQVGDRCTVTDDNAGVSTDFVAAEVHHVLRADGDSVTANTELKLMSIV
jgi:hypothetical protein